VSEPTSRAPCRGPSPISPSRRCYVTRHSRRSAQPASLRRTSRTRPSLSRLVDDLQKDPKKGHIGLGAVFALPEVAAGPRVERVEPNKVVVLHVLMLPDPERAERIGEFWSSPQSRRLRRTADRLRGGLDAKSGTRRDAARGPLVGGDGQKHGDSREGQCNQPRH
jgi:hypothetical protein